MRKPFTGKMSFYHIDEELPPATEVLKGCHWNIDPHNAPYLAGKVDEPSHKLVKVTASQAFGTTPRAKLPQGWSISDELAVVGDISHTLSADSNIIIAHTYDFKQAGEFAKKMGFRPVQAGEFLQLLWWLQQSREKLSGWFYCSAGRVPQYAVLAEYNGHDDPAFLHITFDTCIKNKAENGYASANMDTRCFFVHKN